jgi:hypothetical protein
MMKHVAEAALVDGLAARLADVEVFGFIFGFGLQSMRPAFGSSIGIQFFAVSHGGGTPQGVKRLTQDLTSVLGGNRTLSERNQPDEQRYGKGRCERKPCGYAPCGSSTSVRQTTNHMIRRPRD